MGRQVHFHAHPDDLLEFLRFACARDGVSVILRDADHAEAGPVLDPARQTEVLILWDRTLLPSLRRSRVDRADGPVYYRVPYSSPVLEVMPSRELIWEGQPALLRGRLYGSAFEVAGASYARWYDGLARWIRTRFVKNPVKALGGYVGPHALSWFSDGGVLLPWPAPPPTPEWIALVKAQGSLRPVAASLRPRR